MSVDDDVHGSLSRSALEREIRQDRRRELRLVLALALSGVCVAIAIAVRMVTT